MDAHSPQAAFWEDMKKPKETARSRRIQHSSSASSKAGEFLVSNVKFRVSAPPARPLPLYPRWNDADCTLISDVFRHDRLQDGVDNILSRHGIEPSEQTELFFRSLPDESFGQPTILVVAEWNENSPTVWGRVVKEAKQFVDARVHAKTELRHLDIAVEMIASELTEGMYVSHIPEEEYTESCDGL